MSFSSQVDKSGPFLISSLPAGITVGFPFQAVADLLVLDTGPTSAPYDPAHVLVLGSDYTLLSGGGYNSLNQMQPGSITVVGTGSNAVAVNDNIVVMRGVSVNQLTSLLATGPLTVSLIEQALDKQATLSQQLTEVSGRSLRFDNFEFLDGTLSLAQRANAFLAFQANGLPWFPTTASIVANSSAPGSVASIAALQAVTVANVANNSAVVVDGYALNGDGGGGIYVYNSGSAATANGGTIIAPSVGSGRWIRQNSPGIIPAEVFGAVGAADYGAAISLAIASLGTSGGMVTVNYNPSGVATTPINATNLQNGVTLRGLGGGVNTPAFVVTHTGVGIDCTGSNNVTFEDLWIGGSTVTTPKVGWLLARNSTNNSAENIQFFNSGTTSVSKFSVAALYNYGSEIDAYFGCTFFNNYTGAATAEWTESNVGALASSFQTIATGAQSSVVHKIYGGAWYCQGGPTSNLFYFDGIADFNIYGSFWYAPAGNAYCYFNSTYDTCARFSFDGIRGELGSGGSFPLYAFYFDNGAPQTFVQFQVQNCIFDTGTNVLYAANGATLYGWEWHNVNDNSNTGITCYLASYCKFDMLDGTKFICRSGGVLTDSFLRCKVSGVTITGATTPGTLFFDETTGLTGATITGGAITGYAGEIFSAVVPFGNSVSLSTGTAANIAQLTNLPSGEWTMAGQVEYVLTGATATTLQTGFNTTGNTLGAQGTYATDTVLFSNATATQTEFIPTKPLSLPAAATVYLIGKGVFSNGSEVAYGSFSATRVSVTP